MRQCNIVRMNNAGPQRGCFYVGPTYTNENHPARSGYYTLLFASNNLLLIPF